MVGHGDPVIEEIYNRLKHIIDDVYRKKGLSSIDIRTYFLKPRNFNKLIRVMGDIKHIYDNQKYPLKFENSVYDILFYKVLMDRIYYERDNPRVDDEEDGFDPPENHDVGTSVSKFKNFINKLKKKKNETLYLDFNTFVNEAKAIKKKGESVRPVKSVKAKKEMNIEDFKDIDIDKISTRELTSMIVKLEFEAEKSKSKEYLALAKKYQKALS